MNDARQTFLLEVPLPALETLQRFAVYESKSRTAADDHVLAAWWMQFAASCLACMALLTDNQLSLLGDEAQREADPNAPFAD